MEEAPCKGKSWLIWEKQPTHDSSAVDTRAANRRLEENDVLLIEVFCVDLVAWRHAVAVAEAVNIYLAMGLGVWTETLWLQMGLNLEGAGALRVGRDGGRLQRDLRVGLCRGHGGFLNIWRVGGADGQLGVQSSVVWMAVLICQ